MEMEVVEYTTTSSSSSKREVTKSETIISTGQVVEMSSTSKQNGVRIFKNCWHLPSATIVAVLRCPMGCGE